MKTEDKGRITIALTGRPPVRIAADEWEIVAHASDCDNQYKCQAHRNWELTVRQHKDGRAIVYGVYDTVFQDEWNLRGGQIVNGIDFIVEAIYEVAQQLRFPRRLAEECISSLPAEDI
jgi:hypothetical protein